MSPKIYSLVAVANPHKYDILILRNLRAKIMSESGTLLTLSLNTFIRYYSMSHSKLVGEIARRMQASNGYDYYGSLTAAVRAKISGASNDEIQHILNRSSSPSELSHNKAAYEMFLEKFGTKNNVEVFDKKGKVKLCGGKLVISVSPLFSMETSKSFDVYNIWAAQRPELERENAGVGVYLMQRAFLKTAPNYKYKMFNAVEGKMFGAVNKTIPQAIDGLSKTIVEYASNS